MAATDEIQRLPEEGETIIATVKQMTGHGVYVTLDEYNNMTGFLHISELLEVKKSDKANIFLDFIKSKLNLSDQHVQEIEDRILQKYDYVYDAFEAVSSKGLDAIQNIELSPEIKNAIEDASKRIPILVVEISRIMEITSKKPEGIEMIKNTLANAEGNKGGASIIITYIGAPRYRVVVNAENFKVAERSMNNTIEKTRASIEKQHGTFNFVRQDSKRSQTLQQA